MVLALTAFVCVAILDEASGYQARLSILYLIPIAMMSWLVGFGSGTATAALACVLWFSSFSGEHLYQHPGYFLWELTVMLAGFVAFAWLIDRLHHALSQADERFLRVLEEMRAAVYVADPVRDVVIYANPEMMRATGTLQVATLAEVERRFEAEAGGNMVEHGVVRGVADGRSYVVRRGEIPWGAGKRAVLTVLSDITGQRNAEALREQYREVLHRAAQQATLAEIASALAHEINQPLMVIATYTDACQRLLADSSCDRGEIVAALGKCHAHAVRAASVIERLREFIRHPVPLLARCDAREVVEEALGVLRSRMGEAGVIPRLDLAAGVCVAADKLLLVQVLVNLLRNALDAMSGTPPGARTLAITLPSPAGSQCVFSVLDTGPGLAAGAEDVFRPFFTTKTDGMGLGLAISRSIIEAHGGRLWVEREGGHTAFRFELPVWSAA